MPVINLKGVSLGFDAMPEGWYVATLSEWKFVAKSKASGQPYLALTFTIDEPEEYAGRKAFRNVSLQKNSLWAFKAAMVALGVDPDRLEAEIDTDDLMPDVEGNPCRLYLEVGVNPKTDQPNNSVKLIKPMDFDIYTDDNA